MICCSAYEYSSNHKKKSGDSRLHYAICSVFSFCGTTRINERTVSNLFIIRLMRGKSLTNTVEGLAKVTAASTVLFIGFYLLWRNETMTGLYEDPELSGFWLKLTLVTVFSYFTINAVTSSKRIRRNRAIRRNYRKIRRVCLFAFTVTLFSTFFPFSYHFIRSNINCTDPIPSTMSESVSGPLNEPIPSTTIYCNFDSSR